MHQKTSRITAQPKHARYCFLKLLLQLLNHHQISSQLLQFNWFDCRCPDSVQYTTYGDTVLVLPFCCWKFVSRYVWKQEDKIGIITGCRYSELCRNIHYPLQFIDNCVRATGWSLCFTFFHQPTGSISVTATHKKCSLLLCSSVSSLHISTLHIFLLILRQT